MNKKYYFIAIGGIGMSGLAKYLLECGCEKGADCEVLGSDISDNKYTQKLEKLGAKIFIGHKAENLPEDCTVIASTAIKDDNPELKKAKELGLPIYHRSDLLAEISRQDKLFIGYAGTHGKTTTSGMASYVLSLGGYETSYVVGGFVPNLNSNAHCTEGKYFVAELDESDGTIVKYTPKVTVINNIEADHLDFYTGGLESIMDTFVEFLSGLRKDSIVLVNNDCENIRNLMERYDRKYITYGLNQADYTAKNIKSDSDYTTFDVYKDGEFLTELKLVLKGMHNVYNSLSVLASLLEAGVELSGVKEHFATFSGMGRRFEKVAEFNGITVYDDYAHHPTEVRATLDAAKNFQDKNIIAVFQPHRYTRLQNLWDDFLNSFEGADRVIITDVYSASEAEIEGVSSQIFAEQLREKLNIPVEHISGNIKELAQELLPSLAQNDIVIGMGAGSITALGRELLCIVEKNEVIEIAN